MPLPGFRHRGDGCLIILLLYEGKAQNMGRSPTVGHDPIAQPNYNIKQLASIKYYSVTFFTSKRLNFKSISLVNKCTSTHFSNGCNARLP